MSSDFKRSYKNLKKQNIKLLNKRLELVLSKLVSDTSLERQFKDHSLTGNWKGFRECHVFPDVVLIYKKYGNELLLATIGSHSNIFS